MENDFENVAQELEKRAHRLNSENNPRNLGIDEVIYSVAQFVRILGKANSATNRLSRLVLILTFVSIFLVCVQVMISIDRTDSCADFGSGDIRCTTWIDAGFWKWYIPERSMK
jgi:hypothetical protein